jgi:hypothetical protein
MAAGRHGPHERRWEAVDVKHGEGDDSDIATGIRSSDMWNKIFVQGSARPRKGEMTHKTSRSTKTHRDRQKQQLEKLSTP